MCTASMFMYSRKIKHWHAQSTIIAMLLLRHSSVGIMYIAAALLMHPLALNFFFSPRLLHRYGTITRLVHWHRSSMKAFTRKTKRMRSFMSWRLDYYALRPTHVGDQQWWGWLSCWGAAGAKRSFLWLILHSMKFLRKAWSDSKELLRVPSVIFNSTYTT